MALTRQLFTGEKPANVWWKNHPQWCGEVQRQQPFRKADNDEPYYLLIRDEQSKPKWRWKNEHVKPTKFDGELSGVAISNFQIDTIASGNEFWFDLDVLTIYKQLATELKIDTLEEISRRFGEVRLRERKNDSDSTQYYYHPNFGVFQKKDEK
jgi:CRISPR-associated endonuclease/helicase Cas3